MNARAGSSGALCATAARMFPVLRPRAVTDRVRWDRECRRASDGGAHVYEGARPAASEIVR